MKVRAQQNDTVDAICWRYYRRSQGMTEAVLNANPGLAERGPFLPHGLEIELDALIAQLEPAQRRKLLRDVATKIRQQQQQNIRMQKNPDGSAYEPRRVSGRAKKGRVRRQMFTKLRTVRYMKTRVTASTAEVGFDARAQRIARVHHYGLRDRVTGNSYTAYGAAAASGYGGGYNLPMYDSGGYLPAGKTGIVGENGPELINGPVNIMSRRRTAALAAATAMAFGSLSQPVAARPLHPLSLPVAEYRQPSAGLRGGEVSVSSGPAKYEIHIHQLPGQSAQDTVAEVIRQLDARDRQRAAGRRSSFSDRGDFEP